MPALKILSDFDGVWTDQGLEADEIRRFMVGEAARVLQRDEDRTEREMLGMHGRMMAQPHAWGWAPDGRRISAYVDEDPLCQSSGLCMYIEQCDDADAHAYRQALCGEFGSMAAFAERCYHGAMATYRQRHAPAIVHDAMAQLQAVLALDAEVVVISNSSAEKLAAWFASAGIDAGEGPGHALRLRGSAGKQTLGETDESIDVAGRRVCIDRPLYRRALEEEDPDVVIGDVFSLDLALPHVARGRGHEWAPRILALRRHAHTPRWVLDTNAGGAIDHVVDDFADLAGILDQR